MTTEQITEPRNDAESSENQPQPGYSYPTGAPPGSWDKPSIWTKLAYTIPSFTSYAMAAPLSIELKK